MSCSPFDLRDYVFEELPEDQRREVEAHARACTTCRDEVSRLRTAQAALLTLRDEEIPRRIGFVSDRVWEPSPLRRWWAAFWGSAPRLGFASAALLAAAIVFAAAHRPAPVVATAPPAAVETAKIEEAVRKAVAESDARNERRTAELIAALQTRMQQERKADIEAVSQNFAILQKYVTTMYRASNEWAGVK